MSVFDIDRRRSPYSEWALAIARLRGEVQMTQAEFATKVGTTQSAIARAESGRHGPSAALMQRIATAFGRRFAMEFVDPIERPAEPPVADLGNDKGTVYAVARRIEAVLTEAVFAGALTAADLRLVTIIESAALRDPAPLATPSSLDAAWKAAEEALPNGHVLGGVTRHNGAYSAFSAALAGGLRVYGYDEPAAALTALAELLTRSNDDSTPEHPRQDGSYGWPR